MNLYYRICECRARPGAADDVWRQLDPAQWELTLNPWGILQTVSRDQIERMSADPVFPDTPHG